MIICEIVFIRINREFRFFSRSHGNELKIPLSSLKISQAKEYFLLINNGLENWRKNLRLSKNIDKLNLLIGTKASKKKIIEFIDSRYPDYCNAKATLLRILDESEIGASESYDSLKFKGD